MLSLVSETHTPETCPIDVGGRQALHRNPGDLTGPTTVGESVIPGFRRSAASITSVSQLCGE